MSSLHHRAARRRVLAIGAHPDDALLGAGGYLLQLCAWGHEVSLLTLSSGGLAGDRARREEEERAAALMCGFNVEFGRLDDSEIVFKSALGCIEAAIDRLAPELVLTHSAADTHQDHETVARATIAACRPVPSLYLYEGPSSTGFNPTMTVDCSSTWERKLAALECYPSQMSRRPYVAWTQAVSAYRAWPRHMGSPCEAFTAIRHDPHTYPAAGTDLLTDLLITGARPLEAVMANAR